MPVPARDRSWPSTEYAGRGAGRRERGRVGRADDVGAPCPAAATTSRAKLEPRRLARRRGVVGPGRRRRPATRRTIRSATSHGPRGLADLVVDHAARRRARRPPGRSSSGSTAPWAPYSQAVRTIRCCSGASARTAHSPAALVRPYADRGATRARPRRTAWSRRRRRRSRCSRARSARRGAGRPGRAAPGATALISERRGLVRLGVVDRGPGGAVDDDVVRRPPPRRRASRVEQVEIAEVDARRGRSRGAPQHRCGRPCPSMPSGTRHQPSSCRGERYATALAVARGDECESCPCPRCLRDHPGAARRRPRRLPRVVPRGRASSRPPATAFTSPRPTARSPAPAPLRGIHFADLPPGQAKYVTCVHGAVLDVVVDLRVGSPTFGQWDAVLLDDVDRRAIYLPEGLGPRASWRSRTTRSMNYLCSAPYAPGREHGVHPLDPAIGIAWPTPGRDGSPLEPAALPQGRRGADAGRGARTAGSWPPTRTRSPSRPRELSALQVSRGQRRRAP